MSAPITVLLVDDHELIRSGLAGVFDLEQDMTIVGHGRLGRRGAGKLRRAAARRRGRRPAAARRHRARHRPLDPQGEQHHGPRGADHALRRRPDLRGHAGRRLRLRRQGRTRPPRSSRPPGTPRCRPAPSSAPGLVGAMMRRGAAESTRLSDREHEVLVLLADGLGAGAIGRQALPQRVDRQVPHRPHLPEARRHQPRPGAGHRDAHRPAVQRAPRRLLSRPTTLVEGGTSRRLSADPSRPLGRAQGVCPAA